MRPNLLLPAVSNTDYLIWKEDKDYEGHIKRLKSINDKQVNVVKKYQGLDRLIDYSHKKRELVKDFNNKEFVHNQGLENSRIKKKLVDISYSQSKENKHLQDQNKYTEMLFNNNKVIAQKYKNEVNKQLEQENLIIATRILNQRSQYEKEKQSSHYEHHLLFKKNLQRFKRRGRGLALSIHENNIDEYSPNNSIFEIIRNTTSNSSQLLNNQNSSRTNSANNSFIADQSQMFINDKEDKVYPQNSRRSISVNKTVPLKNCFDERYLIEQITEQSKDINSCEMSVDNLPESAKINKKKLRNTTSIQSSPSQKYKEIDERTKKEIIGRRDIFLTLAIKQIKFKSFIPNEADDDLYYFIVSGGENKKSKTQLKSFKKIQCSNYHLAFISHKFKEIVQKVTFSLWQNKNNNDIFQGEFTVDVSQEQYNQQFQLEMKKITPRAFITGKVNAFVTVTRLNKESSMIGNNTDSQKIENVNKSTIEQNDLNQDDQQRLSYNNDKNILKDQNFRKQQI